MATDASTSSHSPNPPRRSRDPWWIRWLLTATTIAIVGVLVGVPLAAVFYYALSGGPGEYRRALFADADTRHSIFLTLMVAPLAVGLNLIFGIAAAWLIARFRFPGRAVLTTLIDLPFSVSPVVAGLAFVLVFGVNSPAGEWLRAHGYQVIFAPPGLVLATAFVTFPFVARELIPVLEAVGAEEDLAARSLGASGWQLFWRVTLPNIRWGMLYGVILCNAGRWVNSERSMWYRGASAVKPIPCPSALRNSSRNITTALPTALASVLTLLALVTLVAKVLIEPKARGRE